MHHSVAVLSCLLFAATTTSCASPETAHSRENVILVTLDGVRTQEIFGGADLEILRGLTDEGKRVEDTALYKKYWAPTARERREKLLPFFWKTLMIEHGSIAGNRELGSAVKLSNTHRFSYPGYSEILTGVARDDVIASNDKVRNPYPTVLEFLADELDLDAQRVACFASWDVFDWIVESHEGRITSNAGLEHYNDPDPEVQTLSNLQFTTPTPWDSLRHDSYTFHFAMAHLDTWQPRVLYLALGETDDWAHKGRYDRVLETLERTDDFLRELWEHVQSHEQYRDRTSIVITTDHGRGNTFSDWEDHGADVEGAQDVWLAIISPRSQRRGEWTKAETVFLSQVAATFSALLGIDYQASHPEAGNPIGDLRPSTTPPENVPTPVPCPGQPKR